MNRKTLIEVLGERVGVHEAVDGYNYDGMTLRCRDVSTLVSLIRERAYEIGAAYRKSSGDAAGEWSLLDYACVPFRSRVWVPVPFGTRLNVLADVLVELLPEVAFEVPIWS